MDHQKILNLLKEVILNLRQENGTLSIINQINANYDVGNETIYNKAVLKSYLCDYNDVYILERGNINIVGHQVTSSI